MWKDQRNREREEERQTEMRKKTLKREKFSFFEKTAKIFR